MRLSHEPSRHAYYETEIMSNGLTTHGRIWVQEKETLASQTVRRDARRGLASSRVLSSLIVFNQELSRQDKDLDSFRVK